MTVVRNSFSLSAAIPLLDKLSAVQFDLAIQGRFGLEHSKIEDVVAAVRSYLDLDGVVPFPLETAFARMEDRISGFKVQICPDSPCRPRYWDNPPTVITSSGAWQKLLSGEGGTRYCFAYTLGQIFLQRLLTAARPRFAGESDADASEKACKYFAGALLIPWDLAQDYLGRVNELADLCQVSVSCASVRLSHVRR
jgi:hypothetical protein